MWHVVSQLSLDADDTHTGNLTVKRGGETQRADDSDVRVRACVYLYVCLLRGLCEIELNNQHAGLVGKRF